MNGPAWDLVLVGGGLANGLIAYRLKALRPELRVLVLESEPHFGGNHTWSFHATDLTAAQRAWTEPFVAHRWPFYHVAFLGLNRRIDLAYCSVSSERFHRVLSQDGIAVRFSAKVRAVSPTTASLQGGETLAASAVIDGRGLQPSPHLRLAYQKFYGRELRLRHPHRLTGPILMDATVEQHDGYRFVYVLPFGPDRLLVEDTYYADGPELDLARLGARLDAHAHERGWVIAETLRDESGVLPITLAGDIDAFWAEKHEQPCSGLRAGLFHPTTGYSWPDAVRLADRVAALPSLGAGPLYAAIRAAAVESWRAQGFYRALNRMLFRAGTPERRWTVLRRFNRFPEPMIARFYAGMNTNADKLRLLSGKPPVPIGQAVRALMDTAVG